MRKIPVDELKIGMIFDKPLYVDANNILVAAKVPVREGDIDKLIKWGVTTVDTDGVLVNSRDFPSDPGSSLDREKAIVEEYNDLLKKRTRLVSVYKQAREALSVIHESIHHNERFKTDDLEKALINIIRLLQENNNVFLFLYGLDEGKDYLVTHSVNVTFYTLIIGMALKYDLPKLKELGLGTLLIDAGMTKMSKYIVGKQTNLTEQEFNQIKTHTLHGFKLLRELSGISDTVAGISLQHHEQYDGKGYPRGLRGNEISEYARIAAIADSYEAQISNRSYRKKVFFYHAMRNLLSTGVNRFDPVILRVFLSRMSVYPIGSLVELNDGSVGIIIGSVPEKPLRPIIKLIFDDAKKSVTTTVIINLLEKTSLYIVRALDEGEVGINIFDVL